MKAKYQILVTLILMLAVLAACTPAPAPTEQPAARAPVVEQPTTAPVVTVEPVAAPTSAPPVDETDQFPTGKFVSRSDDSMAHLFNNDGTFAFLAMGNPVVEGTYKIEGNNYIELTNNDSSPTCQDHPTYQWSYDGTILSFTAVSEDTCRGRRDSFADTYVLDNSIEQVIKIEATDFSFNAPESITEGWVQVVLSNSGAEPHHVQFVRLNDGVTAQQFEEALKQGEGPAMALTQQVGGVGAIAPTRSARAYLNLPAGEYVLLDLIPSLSDQLPHHAKGMTKTMTVEPAGDVITKAPTADLTIRLKDFSFDMPESIPTGEVIFEVINDGPEPHEFNLLRLEEGKTVEDVVNFLKAPAGPPPFTPVGGINGLDKGKSGYAQIFLQPGEYVAICNIPSPLAEGHPHSSLGMVKGFSVTP